MRRLPLVLLLALVAVAGLHPGAAAAQETPPTTVAPTPPPVPAITFPVIGPVTWTDTYGAPRGSGRAHEGQDLLGAKLQQLVAAADGVVSYVAAKGLTSGGMLSITADDGWRYHYLHLNDDSPGTDDGLGGGDLMFGPGIAKGVRVVAGQLVGYLGDSGNAEATTPHLHFEIEDPSGSPVNPAAALRAARRLDAPVGGAAATASPIPRLAGADRVATAVAVSLAGWPTGAAEVVLAAGDRYAEALPASVLAAARRGPLLLTTGTALPDAVATELGRLRATRVTVVGSVPQPVVDALAASGRTVQRLGVADDPTATAVAVAAAVGGGAGTAVLVNGDRFPDGVSATAVAAGRGWPVLLTTASTVPQKTVDAWRALGVRRLVVVGGTSVVNEKVENFARTAGRCAGGSGCAVERLAGADRYATSVAVAERSLAEGGRSLASVLLGTGTSYADVLAAGPLAAQRNGLVVLVDGSGAGADAATRSFLGARVSAIGDAVILGGSGAVTGIADRVLAATLGR